MTESTPHPSPQAAPRSNSCPETERLKSCIERLTRELASRQAEARPLPSSVMRAYQALIDKHFAQLSQLEGQKGSA